MDCLTRLLAALEGLSLAELILSEASALNVLRFIRWSDASTRGEFGMLMIYAKKDQERIDQEIFKVHPFLSWW